MLRFYELWKRQETSDFWRFGGIEMEHWFKMG